MSAKIIKQSSTEVVVQMKVNLKDNMLASEEAIQEALNEVGTLATAVALQQFDTDGSPIITGNTKWYSKGETPKKYQTPYGEISVNRHVYQPSSGGKTWCPMEERARVVCSTSPRFAKTLSHKFSQGPAGQVREDLLQNHGRKVAKSYIQRVADLIGSVAQAKEVDWEYATPELEEPIATVGIGLDGTCMLQCDDGWREAMTGTISLYDKAGVRQHTLYIGATPEYGKATFYERLSREINRIRARYPDAEYVGVADGAKDNWVFLDDKVDTQILDFFHASGYLGEAAKAVHLEKKVRACWIDQRCHELKHEKGAASSILKELKATAFFGLPELIQDKLKAAKTYFSNHLNQMDYHRYEQNNWPIGSGVTEAACKTLIKQRLCNSGMRWKEKGAAGVISLRALAMTNGRWEQFWSKINQYGMPVVT